MAGQCQTGHASVVWVGDPDGEIPFNQRLDPPEHAARFDVGSLSDRSNGERAADKACLVEDQKDVPGWLTERPCIEECGTSPS